MASNSFLRMLFGNRQVTEPSYAGLRVPRLYSGDDTPLMRQVSPQEKYRQLDDLKVGHDAGHATGGEYQEVAQDSGRNARLQGAVRGIGSDIARLFAQDDQRQPMSLPPVQMGDITPLIDPRWLPRRAMGGPVKKNKPYLINENGREAFQDDATGEVSIIDTEGPAIFTPDEKGKIIPLQPGIQAQLKDILGEPPVEESPTEEVPTTAPTTAPTKEPSVADLLRTKIDDTQRRLAEGATKNPDGTTTYGGKQYRKRNYKDVLKSAGLGVLQSLASAPPTNDLGALLGRAIGGGAAGGVMGATMNNADEKMADRMQLAQLLPQYQNAATIEKNQAEAAYRQAQTEELRGRPTQRMREIEARGQQAIARINRNADVRAGIAKPVINEEGFVELQYLNADANGQRRENELLKGADGQPIFIPGEQGLTWVDPLTQKPVQVRAKQTLVPGATIATGNANRETNVARDNAENYWKTESTNIENQMKWMSDIKNLTAQAIAAESGLDDDPGIRSELDAKLRELTELYNTPLPTGGSPSKAQEARVKRVNELTDEFNKLNSQLLTTMSKSAAGKAKADQIRGLINKMNKPPMLTYTPYEAVKVTGGVSGSTVSESVFIDRLRANGITDPAEQKALINKARADGKIR